MEAETKQDGEKWLAGSSTSTNGSDLKAEPEAAKQSSLALVLSRPSMWLLGLSYFFVYACRQGMANWTVLYLLEEKGVANAALAAARMSGMELGGLFGNLSAGFIADRWLRNNPNANSAGIRVKVGGFFFPSLFPKGLRLVRQAGTLKSCCCFVLILVRFRL